jgi:hypothetical protein
MSLIPLVFLAVFFVIAMTVVIYTVKNGIPPMPTTRYLCEQTQLAVSTLKWSEQGADKTLHVVEAGSGWGTLAFYVAKRNPNFKLTGLENSPLPLWTARLLRLLLRRHNCRFLRQDLYRYDYSGSSLVICYLFSAAMRKLSPRFAQQLPNGAYVISIFFALPGWQAERVIQCHDLYRTKIYIYRVDQNQLTSK